MSAVAVQRPGLGAGDTATGDLSMSVGADDSADLAWRAATWLAAAAAAVLAWSAVGLLGSPGHSWGYGLLLLTVAGGEALLARALFRRAGASTVLAGVVANIAVITTYVVGRTAGLPIGLSPSSPSAASATGHGAGHAAGWADYSAQLGVVGVGDVGGLDVAMLVVLLALVALLVSLLPARTRRVAVNVALLAGVALWAQRFSGVGGW